MLGKLVKTKAQQEYKICTTNKSKSDLPASRRDVGYVGAVYGGAEHLQTVQIRRLRPVVVLDENRHWKNIYSIRESKHITLNVIYCSKYTKVDTTNA